MSVVAEFAAATFSRATGAGLDPHEYQRVTAGLDSLRDWGTAFTAVADGYRERAARAGSPVSAGEFHREAAGWYHVATLAPGDGTRAAADADRAMREALALLEPDARRLDGPTFTGWRRGPAAAPTVVIVPGLDSGKEEFGPLAAAVLRRGLAVVGIDGPGQGVRAATSGLRADYHTVIGQVVDALGVDRVGLIGMSLGGYFAAESAAWEPRVAATVSVSGPYRLRWDELPAPVREIFVHRAGGPDAARALADRVDLTDLARRIDGPLLVVDGGQDVIPGVTNGELLAALAPRGEYLPVPHGDHLLGNATADWLPTATDWLAAALA